MVTKVDHLMSHTTVCVVYQLNDCHANLKILLNLKIGMEIRKATYKDIDTFRDNCIRTIIL